MKVEYYLVYFNNEIYLFDEAIIKSIIHKNVFFYVLYNVWYFILYENMLKVMFIYAEYWVE